MAVILASIFGTLGLLVCACNAFVLLRWTFTWGSRGSMLPIFGGLIVATAMREMPYELLQEYWYLGFLVDPFYSVLLPLCVFYMVSDSVRSNRKRRSKKVSN